MTAPVGRALRRVVAVCGRHPIAVVLIAICLAAVSVVVTITRLRFETSELHLLPAGEAYVTRYREYSKAFGELDELVIAVRGRDVQQSRAFAARLVDTLRAGPIAFNHLAYRVALGDVDGRGLLYLPRRALEQLRDQVYDHQELLESFAAAPGLVTLLDGVSRQFALAFATHFLDLGLEDGGTAGDVRVLRTFVTQLRATIDHPTPYQSPWAGMFAATDMDEDAGYFLSDDKTLLYIVADPVGGNGGFTNDLAAVDEIRRQIATLAAGFPGLQAGVTGGPALGTDGMRAAFHDSQRATVLAFALTLGLLLLAFRRFREPLVMLAVLALSLLWSLGLVTGIVGHLTVFSVMFISIVIGLGIDYGIYVLFRYDEERRLGAGVTEALEVTAARSGPGIVLGALTGAATFYVLLVTDFHGVQELGFIAGTALLSSFVAMVTVFPAALVLLHRRRVVARAATEPTTVPFVEALVHRPALILAGAGLLTAFSLWSARLVVFDYDLLNLQAPGTESVVWERAIIETHGRSSYSALATATSLAELKTKREAFERLSSVASVDSALLFIPDDQGAKSKILRDVAPLVASLRVGAVAPLDVERLAATLETLRRRVGLAVVEAGADAPVELRELRTSLTDLVSVLRSSDATRVAPALERYQAGMVHDFAALLHFLQRNVEPRPVTFADIPPEIRRKFVSDSGRLLLQIHPKVDVWNRAGALKFVDDVRSVDAEVTGTPVITYESIRRMEAAYRHGAVYALIVVGLITAVMIRRVRETALALTPLVLGTLWAIGLMPVFGLKLNLANVWGVPLIIGASAEYGLNVITRAMEARAQGSPRFARSTLLAVAFNGLTTITGFGALMVADHRGMWSLGLLLTLGSVTSLAASLVVLPVLVRLVDVRPPATGRAIGLDREEAVPLK
jgi:uncharacterized protein